jgi:hypothetical protein
VGGGPVAGRTARAGQPAFGLALVGLYAFAAADLDEPRLLGFVQDGLPAYAWTNDEDHPWKTSRNPRLRSVLRALTSS